jgi:hypothetical protein
MNPGTFNRKVSFAEPRIDKSSMGAPKKYYVHSFFMYVSRQQSGSGQEQPMNNRMVVPTRYIYRTHYKAEIDETLQIVDEGIKYNILAIDRVERGFVEIIAEKITE